MLSSDVVLSMSASRSFNFNFIFEWSILKSKHFPRYSNDDSSAMVGSCWPPTDKLG